MVVGNLRVVETAPLPPRLAGAAVDAAVETADAATRAWLAEASENGLTALEEKGVTVQRLTDEERAVFREASLPVYNSDLMSAEDTALWKKLSDENR